MARKEDSARRSEKEAVYTTIVGGRPPGSGTSLGAIPRGIEVLVKKASVDGKFREVLLEKRAAAAEEIGLELAPAEAAMLANIPREQFEAIIGNAKVSSDNRRAFLGKAASVMLAALGTQSLSCRKPGQPAGIEADYPNNPTLGVRPGRPSVTKGIQPDLPTEEKG